MKTTRDNVENLCKSMQEQLNKANYELNSAIKDTAQRQNLLTSEGEKSRFKMTELDNVNKMLDGRTLNQAKKLEQLQLAVDKLGLSKQDKSNF